MMHNYIRNIYRENKIKIVVGLIITINLCCYNVPPVIKYFVHIFMTLKNSESRSGSGSGSIRHFDFKHYLHCIAIVNKQRRFFGLFFPKDSGKKVLPHFLS